MLIAADSARDDDDDDEYDEDADSPDPDPRAHRAASAHALRWPPASLPFVTSTVLKPGGGWHTDSLLVPHEALRYL